MDTLFFTFINKGYVDWTIQFLRRVEHELHVSWKLFVICVDDVSFERMSAVLPQSQIHRLRIPDELDVSLVVWGDGRYQTLTFYKLDSMEYVRAHAPEHIRVLVYVDMDIFFFKDPLPYISEHCREKAVYFQCDNRSSNPNVATDICSGFVVMRRDALEPDYFNYRTGKLRRCAHHVTDQDYLRERIPYNERALLPRRQFPNGVFRDCVDSSVIILHYNWLIGMHKFNNMFQRGHHVLPVSLNVADWESRFWKMFRDCVLPQHPFPVHCFPILWQQVPQDQQQLVFQHNKNTQQPRFSVVYDESTLSADLEIPENVTMYAYVRISDRVRTFATLLKMFPQIQQIE